MDSTRSAGWQAEVGPTYGAEDTVLIGGMLVDSSGKN